jgi:hypothetical protein
MTGFSSGKRRRTRAPRAIHMRVTAAASSEAGVVSAASSSTQKVFSAGRTQTPTGRRAVTPWRGSH